MSHSLLPIRVPPPISAFTISLYPLQPRFLLINFFSYYIMFLQVRRGCQLLPPLLFLNDGGCHLGSELSMLT